MVFEEVDLKKEKENVRKNKRKMQNSTISHRMSSSFIGYYHCSRLPNHRQKKPHISCKNSFFRFNP